MKSGLEGRNNLRNAILAAKEAKCLNEVLPRRPEQCQTPTHWAAGTAAVSMKSGLEGRNNAPMLMPPPRGYGSLNEVRPRRPEQFRTNLTGP